MSKLYLVVIWGNGLGLFEWLAIASTKYCNITSPIYLSLIADHIARDQRLFQIGNSKNYIHFKQMTICPQQLFWNDGNTFRMLHYFCFLVRVASALAARRGLNKDLQTCKLEIVSVSQLVWWIPVQKGQWYWVLVFSVLLAWKVWVNSQVVSNLIHHDELVTLLYIYFNGCVNFERRIMSYEIYFQADWFMSSWLLQIFWHLSGRGGAGSECFPHLALWCVITYAMVIKNSFVDLFHMCLIMITMVIIMTIW